MTKYRIILLLCIVISTVCSIFLIHRINYEEWNSYFKYQHFPVDLNNKTYKLILLWTPYQGAWDNWSGTIGHNQILSGCDSIMNSECIVTSNKDYINYADVVLFSIQDLKQVNYLKQNRRCIQLEIFELQL